jgi:tetratricopeptide (TPR) repeat protein
MPFRERGSSVYRTHMRTPILVALLVAACARELRSTNPELWLELESEHFTLRTDLPEEDARRAIADLELIRNALLAAGWHAETASPARIGVVAVASERELHEILVDNVRGVAGPDSFGQRMIFVSGGGNPLDSEVVKHEVTHALLSEYLVTSPPWVSEGIACLMETLDIDRHNGRAVRGASVWERRDWLGGRKRWRLMHGQPMDVNWSLEIMGTGSAVTGDDAYEFQTLSWALVHWLVDTEPKKFDAFLAGLARGEGMWTAFSGVFPGMRETQIAAAMERYLLGANAMRKTAFPVKAWSGREALRKMPPAEVHSLRAELFALVGGRPDREQKLQEELALARVADPAHPLMLALSGSNRDLKLATERHPEDWRSWVVWYDENRDVAAIRKAAELAPDNAGVLARLAVAEQDEGQSAKALELAKRAVSISPGPFELHSLATVYQKNGRCAEAIVQEERAAESLPDRVDARIPALFRARLAEISARCGKGDLIGSSVQTVEAEPVLRTCRQPLYLSSSSAKSISVEFTIRENGSVAAVAIRGARDNKESGMLRQFVESCSFEPVIIDGQPRRVQLDLTLDAFLH